MYTHNHLTQAICAGFFVAMAATVPLKADDGDKLKSNGGWVGGISIINPTGDIGKIVDVSGYGVSLAAEMDYFRVRTDVTYCSTELVSLFSYNVALEGMYRFDSYDTGLYVFGGLVLTLGVLDIDIASYRDTGYGFGISAGLGFNFNKKIGIETLYTTANKVLITGSLKFDWMQMSLKYRF
jgi:hypothetical protein